MSGAGEDAAEVEREREYHRRLLRGIIDRRAELADHEHVVVRAARLAGISWEEIASLTGTTAAEALDRFGEPPPGAAPF